MTVIERVKKAAAILKGDEDSHRVKGSIADYVRVSREMLSDERYKVLSNLYKDALETTLRLMVWFEDDDSSRYNVRMRHYQEQLRIMINQLGIPKDFVAEANRRASMPEKETVNPNQPYSVD